MPTNKELYCGMDEAEVLELSSRVLREVETVLEQSPETIHLYRQHGYNRNQAQLLAVAYNDITAERELDRPILTSEKVDEILEEARDRGYRSRFNIPTDFGLYKKAMTRENIMPSDYVNWVSFCIKVARWFGMGKEKTTQLHQAVDAIDRANAMILLTEQRGNDVD